MIKNFKLVSIRANKEDNKSGHFHKRNPHVCHLTETLQQTREDFYSLYGLVLDIIRENLDSFFL